jgi:hypothetical protein
VRPWLWQATGVALFLFIPLVLFLFVAHPAPAAASLVAGIILMLGHRFLARPYMERVRRSKCLWCNRWLRPEEPSTALAVVAGSSVLEFTTCPGHDAPVRSFLAWTERLALPLRLGIGLPLGFLLATLAYLAAGRAAPVELATDLFRFVVGLTVNVAALGPLVGSPRANGDSPLRAAFLAHNFALLGVRAILWIFRIVGIYWLWTAGRALFERALG